MRNECDIFVVSHVGIIFIHFYGMLYGKTQWLIKDVSFKNYFSVAKRYHALNLKVIACSCYVL